MGWALGCFGGGEKTVGSSNAGVNEVNKTEGGDIETPLKLETTTDTTTKISGNGGRVLARDTYKPWHPKWWYHKFMALPTPVQYAVGLATVSALAGLGYWAFGLHKEVIRLTDENGRLVNEKGQLINENNRLIDENGELLEANGLLSKQNKEFENRIGELDLEIKGFQTELESLEARRAELQRQLGDANDNNSILSGKIGVLDGQILDQRQTITQRTSERD